MRAQLSWMRGLAGVMTSAALINKAALRRKTVSSSGHETWLECAFSCYEAHFRLESLVYFVARRNNDVDSLRIIAT